MIKESKPGITRGRLARWVGWIGLALASMALVFALGIMAGRALAVSASDNDLPAWSDNNSLPATSGSSFSAASGSVGPEQAGDQTAKPACATCTLPASGQLGVSGQEQAPAGAVVKGADSAPSLPLAPEPSFSCH